MVGIAAALVLGAACVRADVTLDLVDLGQGGTVSSSSFAFNSPSTVQKTVWQKHNKGISLNPSAEFAVTGESGGSSAAGLSAWFGTGASWSYGSVAGAASGTETANLIVSGGTFNIGNSTATLLSGTAKSGTITSTALGGGKYLDTITLVVSSLPSSFSGNNDLSTLVAAANKNGGLDVEFSWFSSAALTGLKGAAGTGSFGGTVSAVSPVPEPTTVVAGAAALGMLALMRVRRAKRQN